MRGLVGMLVGAAAATVFLVALLVTAEDMTTPEPCRAPYDFCIMA